jgi:hypothetical protein
MTSFDFIKSIFFKSMHDGTKPTEFKCMDEKTRNWLTEAFEEYTFNEIKRCHEIFEELSVPE